MRCGCKQPNHLSTIGKYNRILWHQRRFCTPPENVYNIKNDHIFLINKTKPTYVHIFIILYTSCQLTEGMTRETGWERGTGDQKELSEWNKKGKITFNKIKGKSYACTCKTKWVGARWGTWVHGKCREDFGILADGCKLTNALQSSPPTPPAPQSYSNAIRRRLGTKMRQ